LLNCSTTHTSPENYCVDIYFIGKTDHLWQLLPFPLLVYSWHMVLFMMMTYYLF